MVSIQSIKNAAATVASYAVAPVKAYPKTTAAVAALAATSALAYATGFTALSTCTSQYYGFSTVCTPTVLGSAVNAVLDNPITRALADGATLVSAAAAKYLPGFISK